MMYLRMGRGKKYQYVDALIVSSYGWTGRAEEGIHNSSKMLLPGKGNPDESDNFDHVLISAEETIICIISLTTYVEWYRYSIERSSS